MKDPIYKLLRDLQESHLRQIDARLALSEANGRAMAKQAAADAVREFKGVCAENRRTCEAVKLVGEGKRWRRVAIAAVITAVVGMLVATAIRGGVSYAESVSFRDRGGDVAGDGRECPDDPGKN